MLAIHQVRFGLVAMLSLCIAGHLATRLNAQGVSINNGKVTLSGFNEVDKAKTIEFWEKNEKDSSMGHLELQIDLMKQICELEDEEVEKLRLAALRVVTQRVKLGKSHLARFIVSSGLVEGDLSDYPEPEESENEFWITGAGEVGEGIVYLRSEFATQVVEEAFWRKMISSILSSEQMEKFEAYEMDRNLGLLRIAVAQELVTLDQKVCLLPKQRDSIESAVVEALRGRVTWEYPNNTAEARDLARKRFSFHAEEQLSESQLERLELLDAKPRTNVGWGMGGMGRR